MLKRDWGAESNRKLLHLFIPSKKATLVPEFAIEYLPLGITAALVPEFAIEYLPLGITAALVPEFAIEYLPLGITATLMPEFAIEYLPLAELQPWCLSLQWKTCPWAENSDDILIIFCRFISLFKYWWAHPIKATTDRRCQTLYHTCNMLIYDDLCYNVYSRSDLIMITCEYVIETNLQLISEAFAFKIF